jgi:hypothetical protein
MNKLFTSVAVLLVVLFALSPMAFAADADKAFDKCKSEAESEEVADADLKVYVSNCMKDMGAAAADIKAMVDAQFSAVEQETAKSSSQD